MNKTLRKGDKGSDVTQLQTLLNQSGAGLQADGDFGLSTEAAVKYFQETHLGPNGKFLSPDGVVGAHTWWALENQEGSPQRSFLPGEVPSGLSPVREAFLTVPLHEWDIGVKEVPGGSNWSEAPEGGIAKYNNFEHDPQPWCMRFAKWCFRRADELGLLGDRQRELMKQLGTSGSCSKTWKRAVEKTDEGFQMAYPRDTGYVPIPGDMGIMDGHVVLVLRVEKTQGDYVINTVEGNSGNRVKVGFRKGEVFRGFVNLFGDGDVTEAHEFEYGVFSAEDTSQFSTR